MAYLDEDILYNNIEEKYKVAKGKERKAYSDVLDTICEMPRADVVPKSEVERLRKALDEYEETSGLKQAKAEVAREIFEEIEKVIGEQYENYVFDNLEIEGVEQDAIIAFADTMKRPFAELKKKYTGGKYESTM